MDDRVTLDLIYDIFVPQEIYPENSVSIYLIGLLSIGLNWVDMAIVGHDHEGWIGLG